MKIVIAQPLKGEAISKQEVEIPKISRQLAHEGALSTGRLYPPGDTHFCWGLSQSQSQ